MTAAGKIAHVAIAVALIGALAAWWWLRERPEVAPGGDTASPAAEQEAAPVSPPATDAPAPKPASATDGSGPPQGASGSAEALVLPPLDESDGPVRAWLLERAPSAWVSWRVRDDLVRLAAVLLEYAARGQVPRRTLAFVTVGRFEVREEDDRILIAPRSYARYDAIVDQALSLPAEDAAALFVRFEPLLEVALGELGAPAPAARSMLLRAVDHVLATPVPTGPLALVRPKVYYEFADPALEALVPLQKQLLRTGPDNLRKAQAYAKRLREALDAASTATVPSSKR